MGIACHVSSVVAAPAVVSCARAVPATWLWPAMPRTRLLLALVSVNPNASLMELRFPLSGVTGGVVPTPVLPALPPPPHPERRAAAKSASADGRVLGCFGCECIRIFPRCGTVMGPAGVVRRETAPGKLAADIEVRNQANVYFEGTILCCTDSCQPKTTNSQLRLVARRGLS